MHSLRYLFIAICYGSVFPCWGSDPTAIEIESSMVHLRTDGPREWASFPIEPDEASLRREFTSVANSAPWTLSLRQQDVKQTWEVRLNDQLLGRLVRDENDLRTDFEVPVGCLSESENKLEIRQTGRIEADDILLGQIVLHRLDPDQFRRQATIQVDLVDQRDTPIPGRITVVDANGTLMPVGAKSQQDLAVREGVLYTLSGNVSFGVAPGTYRVFAGRGFEYSIDTAEVKVSSGQVAKRTLKLNRQVNTEGWVACDTHVHTVTHSGHGDCTIEERMVTLAGEGIELPIATDHNKHIDYQSPAETSGADAYFTPVIGNEVTTRYGHFNIFPVRAGAEVPDHSQGEWSALFDDIYATPNVRVAILNHARDLHSNYRPFSARHHISLTGDHLDGWPQRFNAMELINSGAVQTDPMELFGDWCGMINHGFDVTPVGSSDSHDVTRYIVGQGRTYIRCNDQDVANIDVKAAVDAFVAGRVAVSYGLLVKLVAGDQHGPGDRMTLADSPPKVEFTAEVHGPEWTQASQLLLYVNGTQRFAKTIDSGNGTPNSSLKAIAKWQLLPDDLKHDVWVSAVALGPGIEANYWKSAKPYQPDRPEFRSYVFSSTGPIKIDVDGDGRFSPPREYALQIVEELDGDIESWVSQLSNYHASVIHQAMSILEQSGNVDLASLHSAADGNVRAEISRYRRESQESQRARVMLSE